MLSRDFADGSEASAEAADTLGRAGDTALANRHRVLVLDDSKLIRGALGTILGQLNFEVRGVGSEEEAEESLATWFPQTIICDLEFAGIPGDLLCREIKKRLLIHTILYSNLPVVELSKRARATGADSYVSKRKGFAYLSERLIKLLRAAPSHEMAVADLEMRDIDIRGTGSFAIQRPSPEQGEIQARGEASLRPHSGPLGGEREFVDSIEKEPNTCQ